jgi:Ca2+-binding EF-hand superfamily protein
MFTDVSNRVTAMQRAKAKFEELDTDQSGYLETAEISEMVDWMLLFYSKEGEPLTFAEKDAMKIDILALVDSDRDGKLSLAEFTVIFQQVENKKVDARRRKSLFVF